MIDFRRDKLDMPGKVLRLEYDPNRTAFIALTEYEDGERRYILAPVGLAAGDTVVSSPAADIKPGNCLPLEKHPRRHGHPQHRALPPAARPAGALRRRRRPADAKEGNMATIRMPSGEMRKVRMDCRATIGQVGNIDHANVSIGKAGASATWASARRSRLRDEPG